MTPEILGLIPSHITMHGHHAHPHQQQQQQQQHHPPPGHHPGGGGQGANDSIGNSGAASAGGTGAGGNGAEGATPMSVPGETPTKKMYTPEAMEAALDALRNGSMSLTRAAAAFGIPSTTLWQRAHRLGIDTPMKKDPSSRHWSDDDLRLALDALRAGRISANRASKEYGIPSSTLYKIARKVIRNKRHDLSLIELIESIDRRRESSWLLRLMHRPRRGVRTTSVIGDCDLLRRSGVANVSAVIACHRSRPGSHSRRHVRPESSHTIRHSVRHVVRPLQTRRHRARAQGCSSFSYQSQFLFFFKLAINS